jgi:hypothetical protein
MGIGFLVGVLRIPGSQFPAGEADYGSGDNNRPYRNHLRHGSGIFAPFSYVLRGRLRLRFFPARPWLSVVGIFLTSFGVAVAIWARYRLGEYWSARVALYPGIGSTILICASENWHATLP